MDCSTVKTGTDGVDVFRWISPPRISDGEAEKAPLETIVEHGVTILINVSIRLFAASRPTWQWRIERIQSAS